ncbi:MAG: site-specific integrase [Desulfovibrio sp.]|nr:site-specific integrase [Desulfovibrio sp.]MBI4958746.1 site-specific integrase [Desulfovibrio sp.]
MAKRQKTKYPGVFTREARRIGGRGTELVYYVVFKKNGKLIEEKVGRQFADDMTPARAAAYRAERIEGKRQSRKDLREADTAAKEAEANRWTIERIWEEYKHQREIKGLKQDECRYTLYISPRFANKVPAEILTLDVDRLRVLLTKKQGKSPQTVKHVIALLRRLVRFAVLKGLCPAPEPSRLSFEIPRVDNCKTEDLTPDQLSALIEAMEDDPNPWAAGIMKMALLTGMRRGEMFKLHWEDVDFERGFIHIRDPKGGPSQKVPLNDPARLLFESLPRTDSPFVFPGRGGKQRVDINHQVARIKQKAGLPDSFRAIHGLRHVYATMLASSGDVDMYTLQKLMTHKSPQMTQRYAHLRDDALKRASGVAGEIFSKLTTDSEDRTKNEKSII